MSHRSAARPAELEALYEARFGDFVRVAAAITGSLDAGRDAVQESFAKLLRSRSQLRAQSTLAGWAWRTVVNTAHDARRRRQLEERGTHTEAVPAYANGHASDPELRALVALLPERQRLAIFLRYYADLDYRQIAEALDVQEGTVAATLHRAHASLRTSLGEVTR